MDTVLVLNCYLETDPVNLISFISRNISSQTRANHEILEMFFHYGYVIYNLKYGKEAFNSSLIMLDHLSCNNYIKLNVQILLSLNPVKPVRFRRQ